MLEELNEEASKVLESYLPGKAVTDLVLNGGPLAETHVAVGDEHEGVFYPKGTIEEGGGEACHAGDPPFRRR